MIKKRKEEKVGWLLSRGTQSNSFVVLLWNKIFLHRRFIIPAEIFRDITVVMEKAELFSIGWIIKYFRFEDINVKKLFLIKLITSLVGVIYNVKV